jgi:hypothetical protein
MCVEDTASALGVDGGFSKMGVVGSLPASTTDTPHTLAVPPKKFGDWATPPVKLDVKTEMGWLGHKECDRMCLAERG